MYVSVCLEHIKALQNTGRRCGPISKEEQLSLFGDFEPVSENPEYDAFVEKFKPKKTTDDCYTPARIFEAVKSWAVKKYGIDPDSIVRPFWPGADYKRFPYPDGCVVLDNPPPSILSQIVEYYQYRKIPLFSFAPSLTVLVPGLP